MGRVRLEVMKGSDGNYCWGMKEEEYMADFCLVSKRALEEEEYQLFRFHFLLGADWKLCCRRLKMDRGSFFHNVYRIEQKLGRVYRELQPHALFPLDEYFGGTVRKALPEGYTNVFEWPLPINPERFRALRPPIRKVA